MMGTPIDEVRGPTHLTLEIPGLGARQGGWRTGFVRTRVRVTVERGITALLVLGLLVPTPGQTPVDRPLEQAIAWYTGTAGRMDDERARQLLLEAIGRGDTLAQMWLARCHSRGRMGFSRDPVRANTIAEGVIDDVRRLAEAGDSEAIFLMGTAYDEGLATTPDAGQAAAWFRRAADRGHILAQHNLGNAYADGRGVAQDEAAAINWWRKAADRGDTVPQFRLAQMYEQGRGTGQDLAKARQWYQRAAARGYAPAVEAVDRLVPWTSAGTKNGVTLAYRDDAAVDAREVRAAIRLVTRPWSLAWSKSACFRGRCLTTTNCISVTRRNLPWSRPGMSRSASKAARARRVAVGGISPIAWSRKPGSCECPFFVAAGPSTRLVPAFRGSSTRSQPTPAAAFRRGSSGAAHLARCRM